MLCIINDQYPFHVCFCGNQSRFDCISKTILCRLKNHVKRLKRFHLRQILSVGTRRCKLHGEECFSLTGIALDNRQLAKRNVRIPEPFHLCLLNFTHTNHRNRFLFRFCAKFYRFLNIFSMWQFFSVHQNFIPVLCTWHQTNNCHMFGNAFQQASYCIITGFIRICADINSFHITAFRKKTFQRLCSDASQG